MQKFRDGGGRHGVHIDAGDFNGAGDQFNVATANVLAEDDANAGEFFDFEAKDGATALADWVPSDNGKLLAYAIQDGGSDWRVIKLMDATKGKVLKDEIKWAKFTGISWIGNTGFLYSRFPEPKEGQAFQQPRIRTH